MIQKDINDVADFTVSISNTYGSTVEDLANDILQNTMSSGVETSVSETLMAISQKCFAGALDKNGRHYRFTKK